MLRGCDETFSNEIKEKAYSVEEQCCGLLSKELGEIPNIIISSDSNFNANYNEKILSFADEHSLLSNGRIQNVVFLGFILARLVKSQKLKSLVFRYLRFKYNSTFDIYPQMLGDNRSIDSAFFESLRALDDKNLHATMEIVGENKEDIDEDSFRGNVVFTKAGFEK